MNQPGFHDSCNTQTDVFAVCTLQTPTQDMSWTSLAAHVAIAPLANRLRWQLALKLTNTNDYTIINQIASTCVRHSERMVDFLWCKNKTWLGFGWVGLPKGAKGIKRSERRLMIFIISHQKDQAV